MKESTLEAVDRRDRGRDRSDPQDERGSTWGPGGRTHRHHLIPKSRGGADRLWNLVTLSAASHGLIHDTSNSHDRDPGRAMLRDIMRASANPRRATRLVRLFWEWAGEVDLLPKRLRSRDLYRPTFLHRVRG